MPVPNLKIWSDEKKVKSKTNNEFWHDLFQKIKITEMNSTLNKILPWAKTSSLGKILPWPKNYSLTRKRQKHQWVLFIAYTKKKAVWREKKDKRKESETKTNNEFWHDLFQKIKITEINSSLTQNSSLTKNSSLTDRKRQKRQWVLFIANTAKTKVFEGKKRTDEKKVKQKQTMNSGMIFFKK